MVRRSRLNTANNSKRRLCFVLLLLLCLTITVSVVVKYKEWLSSVATIWQETFPVESQVENLFRGTIYDRNFKELAYSLERVSLFVRPREVKDVAETASILSKLLALPESELLAKMGSDSHLVWLRRDIGQEEEDAVEELNLSGIYLDREVARYYPMQEYASHLIGYSENDQGLAGVEHYYNRLLNHERVLQRDIPTIDLKGQEQTSVNGHDLVLTLDMKIQAILENYIAGLGEEMGGGRISALLLNTAGGEIIAGVNFPSYNLNSVWQNEKGVLVNLFLTPMLVPDEIRKFFRDVALLQGGWEQETQVYPWSLVGSQMSFSRQLRLWDRLHLTTNLQVDFSGDKKKSHDLQEFSSCFPALDLGTVPKTAAPLKVLLGMTHLLNGGKKIQPHILYKIMERPDRREFFYDAFHGQSSGKKVFPSLISTESRRLLKSQGQPGVLGSMSLSGDTVSLVRAGSDVSVSYYVRDQMALVVIPADKPELILLLASRSKELTPGVASLSLSENIDSILPSMVALQQIRQNVVSLLEVEEGEERNFTVAKRSRQFTEKSLEGMLDKQIVLMPDLKGLSLRKSLRLLQRAGLSIRVKGTGRVVSQSPKAGKAVAKGEKCVITLKMDSVQEKAL